MTTKKNKKNTKNQNSKREKKVLLVARESGIGAAAEILLGHLFHTIVKGLEHLDIEVPDFGEIVDCFQHPQSQGAKEFRKKGMKAVLVQREDYDVLLSLGSARKLNETGDNAFVDVLASLLETGEYDRVITTSISRLCRNTMLAGKLEHALSLGRTAVLLGQQEIKVWKPFGKLIWVLLVWFANFEAQQIEARLTAGKVARARNGEWSFGYAPPPGWKLTEDDRVEVDTESADAVRWLIGEVTKGRTNFSKLAREVVRRWPDLESRRGGGRLAGHRLPARQLRKSWLHPAWLRVYAGEPYRAEFIPHEERGKPEDERDPELIAEVEFELPRQPKPIATQAQIDRVIAVLDAASPSRKATGRSTTLGAGISTDADEVEVDPALLDGEEGQAA